MTTPNTNNPVQIAAWFVTLPEEVQDLCISMRDAVRATTFTPSLPVAPQPSPDAPVTYETQSEPIAASVAPDKPQVKRATNYKNTKQLRADAHYSDEEIRELTAMFGGSSPWNENRVKQFCLKFHRSRGAVYNQMVKRFKRSKDGTPLVLRGTRSTSWKPEEDEKLTSVIIEHHGLKSWPTAVYKLSEEIKRSPAAINFHARLLIARMADKETP